MSNGGRRAELDGVRGIAILLVLVGHIDNRLWPLAAAGVALFFTLSGYLITGLLLAERKRHGQVSLRRFYARRMTRLAPPLFVMLLVMGAVAGSTRAALLAPMTWTANYAQLAGVNPGAFGHTWSLSVEEQFYLIWPLSLLLLLRLRRPVAVLLGVMAVLTLWRVGLSSVGFAEYGYRALETAGVSMLAGCALALTGARLPRRLAGQALALLALTALVVALLGGAAVQFLTPVFTTPAAVALIAASGGSRWLAWRPLAFCGVASYSLYLWHVPVSQVIGAEPVGLLAGIAAGLVAYAVVERPLMAWREGRRVPSVVPARAPVGRLDGSVGRVVASRS